MGEGYKIRDQFKPHHLTLTLVDWVDLFTHTRYIDIIINSLKYCQDNKGLLIYAFVIMPTHLHLMVSSKSGQLSATIRDMKRHTSKTLVEMVKTEPESRREWILEHFSRAAAQHKRNNKFQVWMQHNHPIELFSNKFIWQRLNYIHNNPVKKGFVEYPEDYLYSSARNYADKEGVLDVILVTREMKTVLNKHL